MQLADECDFDTKINMTDLFVHLFCSLLIFEQLIKFIINFV